MRQIDRSARSRPVDLIETFEGLDVLVIGEAMLDSYLHGSTDRLCREAPVPVVTLTERVDSPGGAGNTAANLSVLGARVHFLSVIGDDQEGKALQDALREQGVSTDHLVIHPTRRTVAKHRVLAQSHMLVRYDQGSTEPLDAGSEAEVIECLTNLWPNLDALVVSDYGYGILTRAVVRALSDLQERSPLVLVVDSKNIPNYRNAGVTAVKPNYGEAIQLLGLRDLSQSNRERADLLTEYGDRILDISGARIAAVTLDSDGALIFERGKPPYRTYARPTNDSRAAGAGDTFVSPLTLAIASGASTAAAGELASAAAAIVVSKEGTSSCSAAELIEHMGTRGKYYDERERLAARLELHRRQGQRVVFTNGCFDILHSGHITYLNRAKALGDILVVGVNSDEGVRRLKGPERPINSLDDRVQVLAALSSVDYIIPFDQDTPIDLLRALRPDIFAKGGDYSRDRLPEVPVVEQELGGRVHILPYLQDHSTTSIIEKIREKGAGAQEKDDESYEERVARSARSRTP